MIQPVYQADNGCFSTTVLPTIAKPALILNEYFSAHNYYHYMQTKLYQILITFIGFNFC
jgi:hypothetical protein